MHLSHKNKFEGLAKVNLFSYLYQGGNYPLYIGITNRSVNDIPDTRLAWTDHNYNFKPEIGEINYSDIEEFSQQEIGLKIATIYEFKEIILGISIKPFYTGLVEYSAWGLSGDLATIMYPYNEAEFSLRIEDIIGFKSWNTGNLETIAPLLMMGGQIQFLKLLIGAEAGSRMEGNTKLNYHFGFDFLQHKNIFLRGGTSHNSLFSAGIGISFQMFQIDYAYVHSPTNTPFAASHIISSGFFLEKINQIKEKITP